MGSNDLERRTTADLPGIFCLEGEWSEDLQHRLSVRPLLELLEQLGIAQSIHRDVATTGDFSYYLEQWKDPRYEKFRVLYLAMHGDAEGLWLGKDGPTLDELGEELAGKCAGCVVYFGSCLTMKAADDELKRFAKRTGARAVIGYRREVDWAQVASFELLLLQELVTKVRSDAIYNSLVATHPVLTKRFGLVVATKNEVHRVPLRTARTSTEA
ncbi:DUF6642 family protein [Brachybacterium huguangmaarense]